MNYIGEALESSTLKFTAQARELDGAPDLGSLVKIDNGDFAIFAVVSGASTGSSEPNRRPGAYGLTREQLAESQPQIFELLKTDFTGIIVGHMKDGRYFGYLPPRPARIHAFVYACTDEEVRMVAGNFNYLRNLCTTGVEPGDELVAAALRRACGSFPSPHAYLVEAGRELLKILRDDYDRFTAIMNRIR